MIGDGASAVSLGSLPLSSITAAPVTQYLPIPASVRGQTSTLQFQLVSGAPLPTAVVEVSSVEPVGDLLGLNGDRKAAVLQGMTAFTSFANDLGRLSSLAAALPLQNASGSTSTVSNLLDVPGTL